MTCTKCCTRTVDKLLVKPYLILYGASNRSGDSSLHFVSFRITNQSITNLIIYRQRLFNGLKLTGNACCHGELVYLPSR
ncbi:MAG: hypothetical protein WCE54_22900 [Ignavibacteriaceae bacterium]